MELLVRLIFILVIFAINYCAITILPNIPFFNEYKIEVTILIPFICLVFFDYYQNLFNNYYIKINKKEIIKREHSFIFTFEIYYYGKQLTKISIIGVSSNVGIIASLVSKPDNQKYPVVEDYEKNLTITDNLSIFELIIQIKNTDEIKVGSIPISKKNIKKNDKYIILIFLIGNRTVKQKYIL